MHDFLVWQKPFRLMPSFPDMYLCVCYRDITDKTAEIVLLLYHSFCRVFRSVLIIYFSYRVLYENESPQGLPPKNKEQDQTLTH